MQFIKDPLLNYFHKKVIDRLFIRIKIIINTFSNDKIPVFLLDAGEYVSSVFKPIDEPNILVPILAFANKNETINEFLIKNKQILLINNLCIENRDSVAYLYDNYSSIVYDNITRKRFLDGNCLMGNIGNDKQIITLVLKTV